MLRKPQGPKVLLAVLDWGLGHASRCIPVIEELLRLECQVYIAASGKQTTLLQNEFPDLEFLNLPGYNVRYSKYKRLMPIKILWQIPKIINSIRKEHAWLQHMHEKHSFDLIISDNRYGLYHQKLTCVIMTHQLQVYAKHNLARKVLLLLHYKFINRFTFCWVPDYPGKPNIAGRLSHPHSLPEIPVKYLGSLSRFKAERLYSNEFKYLFVLSGPEPQRSLLETKVFLFADKCNEKIMIVRGLPGNDAVPFVKHNCVVKNHLSNDEMEKAFEESEYIISRCGYTTVMEILSLQKKSVLIPTPGQTEQEYLATHLMQQHWSFCCNQNEDLYVMLKRAENFAYDFPVLDEPLYPQVISTLVNEIRNKQDSAT